MKLFIKSFLSLSVLILYDNAAYSLSDSQIKEFCQRKTREASCIKNLKYKRLKLLQGDQIEIPVLPYRN